MNPKQLLHAIASFEKKNILVIGDIMLDKYTFGEVSRISPEAPVPILRKTSEKFVPGGAGNVASNLASLGASVELCGVVGNDHNRDVLFDIFNEQGITTKNILVDTKRPTTFKHRFVSGVSHQLLRVDAEVTDELREEKNTLLTLVDNFIKDVDIVIFSDYAKGVFSEGLTKELIKIIKNANKKIIADIKPEHKAFFKGVDMITPNIKEAKEMTGLTDIGEMGEKLIKYFGCDVLLTRSEEGMSLFAKNGTRKDFPTKKIRVFDVSGAGDTVVAAIALGIVGGLKLEDAVFLANYAGGVVVQQPGTKAITKEELQSAVQQENHLEAVDVVPKVWGHEKWIENNEKYCSKLLWLKSGYQCSLHYHKVKDEMFLITKGHVRLEIGDKIVHMRQGNFVRIPPGTPHRFRGIEDSEILEVSTHHMEEDSYRLEESRKVE